MNKKIVSQIAFLTSMVLLIAILAVPLAVPQKDAMAQAATPAPTHASNSILSIVPASTNVNPGDSFDISVRFNTDIPTWGIQFEITYNPSLVEITGVQMGSFYQEWASQNGAESMMIPSPAPDNSRGVLPTFSVIILGAESGKGPVGEGEVVLLNAKAKPGVKGSVEFKLSQVQVSDTGIYGIAVEVGGVRLQNAVVAIGSDAPPQQPAAISNPGLQLTAQSPSSEQGSSSQLGSSSQPEPTIERRVPTAADNSSSGGIAWEIYLPIAVIFIVGLVGFVLTRNRSSQARPEKK